VNLLLLIYALIAGLTGVNTGPSGFARATQVAESAAAARTLDASQVVLAAHAFAARAALPPLVPGAMPADARRVAACLSVQRFVPALRIAAERRRE